MQLLITDIQWDTDGMGVEECNLPATVIVFGLSSDCFCEYGGLTDDVLEVVSSALSDAFGFCHKGFSDKILAYPKTHADGGFFPERLGVMWIRRGHQE